MHDHNFFKEKQRLSRNCFYAILLSCVLAGILFIVILFKYMGMTVISLLLQILTSLVIALFTILVVDRYFKTMTQDGHDKYVKDTILDLLSVEKSELINNYYDKEKIKGIVSNCIQVICDKFAKVVYENVFDRNIERFREDFVYIVQISEPKRSAEEEDKLMYVDEELAYTKYVRTNPQGRLDVCNCFFAFDDSTLNKAFDHKKFNDGTFFFRGILKNESLIEKIKEATSSEDILKYLNFKITFLKRYDDNSREGVVCEKNINVEIVDNGILIKTNIPVEYLSYTDSFTSYRAKIECEFPIKENIFYCVFSEPTVSTNMNTQFRIVFPTAIISDPERIQYLALLSCEDDVLKLEPKTNSWVFSTKKAIFPRSGFMMKW